MAKPMTKSQLTNELAESVSKKVGAEIKRKVAAAFIQAQAELAYKNAKNQFVIPGIGKLELRERPARKMVMRFGPKAGQEVMVPKKKVVKFRIAKAAKDAILGAKK